MDLEGVVPKPDPRRPITKVEVPLLVEGKLQTILLSATLFDRLKSNLAVEASPELKRLKKLVYRTMDLE
jgi:hypothetical protein